MPTLQLNCKGERFMNEGDFNAMTNGYGLYDRALGIMYMLGAWDYMDKFGT